MPDEDVDIANMALARIGAKRIEDLEGTELEAVHANLHYAQCRDALLRSYDWRFAVTRAELEEDESTPAFGWDHQYALPDDCLRVLGLYEDEPYTVEGALLLTDEATANIVYIAQIDDPAVFDPLFTECLVLALAIKLIMPLAQDKALRAQLESEVGSALARAKAANAIETDPKKFTYSWLDARDIGSH